MKRSEAVNKIQVLLETMGYKGSCNDGEEVLNLIEKLGMLPPTVYLGDSGIIKTTDLLDYSELDYYVAWEDEESRVDKGD